jgi:hypothetical protein
VNPSSIVDWLEGLPGGWAYLAVLVVAFAEHALFVGTFVPGEVLLPLTGVAAATTGATGRPAPGSGRFARPAVVRELYRRHGALALVLGRFVAGVAPFVAPGPAGAAWPSRRRSWPWLSGGCGRSGPTWPARPPPRVTYVTLDR